MARLRANILAMTRHVVLLPGSGRVSSDVLERERLRKARIAAAAPGPAGSTPSRTRRGRSHRPRRIVVDVERTRAARRAPMQHGHHAPVKIDEVHHEQPQRAPRRAAARERLTARGIRKKNGSAKCPNDEHLADRRPRARLPLHVVDRLLGNVGVPDQEVLREGDVGPEHGEAEEQLADVVEVLDRDDPAQRPRAWMRSDGERAGTRRSRPPSRRR